MKVGTDRAGAPVGTELFRAGRDVGGSRDRGVGSELSGAASALMGGLGGLAGHVTGGAGMGQHMQGMMSNGSGLATDYAMNYIKTVPGGATMVQEAKKIWHSDVQGGFTLGDAVDMRRMEHRGMRGYRMTSVPDGAEVFLAEESQTSSCCCSIACSHQSEATTFSVIAGNILTAPEQLTMGFKIGCCGCGHHVMDIRSPDGSTVAYVEENHGCCCCHQVNTHADVGGKPKFTVVGTLPCCSSSTELDIESEPSGDVVGKIARMPNFLHIQFPEGAYASEKAALLGAALLTDIRLR
eukprot:TRINITY_DN122429_c0_g1_i1.p1 TRINITY_DN122429_c0_g1~~TRINITY_DN122429_c0_g1_i1.p1  ORF type:complete len:295 (-),score=47.59 TRINITY_DN122429_c0_g1_i1:103-987(-)